MSGIAELIRRADERLRSQVGVAAGLTDAVRYAGLDGMQATDETLLAAQKLLAGRKGALATAQRRVRQLEETVARLSRALPFLEETWPRERDRLRRALGDDPRDGFADWLAYWFAAASTRRADALRRLRSDVPLPDGFGEIGERFAVAARALEEDDWPVCREILLIGAAGVRVGDRQVPDSEVRDALLLLAARLATHAGRFDEAEVVLGAAERSAARLAILSRSARLRHDDEEAQRLLTEARALDPADLDVACELIVRAGERGNMDAAMDAAMDTARAAVEALGSLGDVEGDVGPLVDPPAQLWTALAERARDEDDGDGARSFLNRVVTDDDDVLATAEEVRATVAATDADRRRALLLAGYRWSNAGRLSRARRDYEAAADGTPADAADARVQAAVRLRLADVIAVTARHQPYSAVATELEYALGLVRDARERENWSYLTESDLCIQLSRVPGRDDRAVQERAALLAAAAAVSAMPGRAASWQALADAANACDLYLVAEAAAATAHRIDPDNEAARAVHVRALVNTGRYADALTVLGDADDPDGPYYSWWQCVRGLIALRQGAAEQAVGHYAGLTINAAWPWAWNAYIRALVVAGDLTGARQQSAELMRAGAGRTEERSWLAVAAFDARLNWRLDAALAAAGRLAQEAGDGDFRVRYAQAEVLLLGGDRTGWSLLSEALAADPRPVALDVWEREEFPVLTALAAERGVVLTPPADVVSAVRARASDPVAELRAAVPDTDEAARVEAALGADQPAGTSPGRPAHVRPDLPLLRVPASRLDGAEGPELREYVAGRMELAAAEDLEPDGFELRAGGRLRVGGHLTSGDAATAADLLSGDHQWSALATRSTAEVIAAAYYQVTPSGQPVPLTVADLAHRGWQLRGMPAGTQDADWDAAEHVFREFVTEDAYFRWEKRGQPFGDPVVDWLAAEEEVTQKGVVPDTVVDDRLRFRIAEQDAFFRWEKRGRPSFGNPLVDWPT